MRNSLEVKKKKKRVKPKKRAKKSTEEKKDAEKQAKKRTTYDYYRQWDKFDVVSVKVLPNT